MRPSFFTLVAARWLFPCFLSCAAFSVGAHNLDEIAEKMAGKGKVPIGGAFALSNSDGKLVTDKTYSGKWELIFFGYLSCADVCSTVMNDISNAMGDLGPDATKVQPIFITMDPVRDTSQRISDYLSVFDNRIVGLRGSEAQTLSVIKAFHVYSKQRSLGGNQYAMDHSAVVYLMKPDGSLGKVMSGDFAGHRLVEEIKSAIQ